MDLELITVPTLLVDKGKCLSNIQRMANKASRSNIKLAPHFKSHHSRDIAKWFRDFGVEEITVSSVSMANYFAHDGWRRIFIAFPINRREIKLINELAGKYNITMLINDIDTLNFLNLQLSAPAAAYIEIETSYERTGIPFNESDKIRELVSQINESGKISLRGLYSHAGHSYNARSKDEILKIHSHHLKTLINLKSELKEDIEISLGDTPSCSVAESFEGISNIRPGNFIFMIFSRFRSDRVMNLIFQ